MSVDQIELATWRNEVLRGETLEGFVKWKLQKHFNTLLTTTRKHHDDRQPKKALQGAASKDS